MEPTVRSLSQGWKRKHHSLAHHTLGDIFMIINLYLSSKIKCLIIMVGHSSCCLVFFFFFSLTSPRTSLKILQLFHLLSLFFFFLKYIRYSVVMPVHLPSLLNCPPNSIHWHFTGNLEFIVPHGLKKGFQEITINVTVLLKQQDWRAYVRLWWAFLCISVGVMFMSC